MLSPLPALCYELTPSNTNNLVRIGLNGRVSRGTRDTVFMSAALCALAHAGYVMSQDSTMGISGKKV